jgi:hypothetical protein
VRRDATDVIEPESARETPTADDLIGGDADFGSDELATISRKLEAIANTGDMKRLEAVWYEQPLPLRRILKKRCDMERIPLCKERRPRARRRPRHDGRNRIRACFVRRAASTIRCRQSTWTNAGAIRDNIFTVRPAIVGTSWNRRPTSCGRERDRLQQRLAEKHDSIAFWRKREEETERR